MQRDPELSAILDQAARNLNSLELLVRTSSEDDLGAIGPLRQRLEALQIDYRNETNALTCQVIERAIDRRTTDPRRRAKMRTAQSLAKATAERRKPPPFAKATAGKLGIL
jgi:hypothetical protein